MASALFPANYPPGSRVPVDVAQRVLDKDATTERPFVSFLKGIYTRYSREQNDLDWLRFSKCVMNERFYQGDQLGKMSRLTGTYVPGILPNGKRDMRYVHNWVRGFSDGITTQHTLSQTELVVVAIPDPGATDHAKGGAKISRRILDHYSRKLITEKFKQRESKLGQFTGQMVRHFYWDFSQGENFARRPIFGQQTVKVGQDAAQCMDCGEANEPNDAAMNGCGYCGSQNVQHMPAPTALLPTIEGHQLVPIGDLVCHCIPATQLKWDRTVNDFEDSMYLRWRCRMRPERIKRAIPWWQKVSGVETDDPGLRAEMSLQRGIGNIHAGTGWSGNPLGLGAAEAETVTVDRWWLELDAYCEYKFPVDVPLVSGDGFQAGKYAGDYFPDGLYCLLVNNEAMDFRNEAKNDYWEHTPVVLVPSRIDGDSLLEDLIEPQKEVNDVKALQLANIKFVTGAGLVINTAVINRDEVPSKPFEIGIAKPGLDPAVDITRAMVPVPRMALPAEAYKYADQQLQEMQQMSKQYPAVVGSEDPTGQSGTATGASLQSQAARSQRSPELALKAGYEANWGRKILKIIQENATDEMYATVKGKTGEAEILWFKGSDIPNSFAVTHRPRSYIPKNESDRRADIMALLQAVGGWQGAVQVASASPELWDELQERFDVTIDLTHADLTGRIGRIRIDVMTEQSQKAQMTAMQMGNPAFAVQMLLGLPEVQVDPREDHQAAIKWLDTWLLTDEALTARKANPALIQAVHGQIQAHQQATIARAQEEQQMQMAAQAPAMQAQQEQQAQMMQQQQTAQQQAMQMQQAQQQQGAQIQAGLAEHKAGLEAQKAEQANAHKKDQSLFAAAIQQAAQQNAATQPPSGEQQ